MALGLVLLAPLLVLAAPKRLELVAPADGFVAGREDVVAIAALDSAGTLSAATGTPVVTGAAGAPERLADGLWQVKVVPGESGVALAVSLDGATGKLDAKAAPGPVLTLTLAATDLSPGQRGSVIAVVDVRSASGTPIDGLTPVLTASMGTAGAAKRIAPGKWSAVLKMSNKRYPHTVMVVASLARRDAKPASDAITLRGRATIPITSEPNAKITVRVGKRAWGPLATDASGAVEAAVEAGPGDTSMEIESLDAAGNKNTRSVPLDMPPYPRLWAAAFAESNGLDGRMRVTVHAAALDRRGEPGGEAPKVTVSGNAIELSGTGVFTGSSLLALPAGTHTVTVVAGDEKKTLPITAAAPPAVAVALEVAGNGTLAMGSAPTAISAYRVDAQGKRVAGEAPRFSYEGLKMIGEARSGNLATAKIAPIEGRLPPSAWVGAKASGPGFALSSRRALTVGAGEAANLDILSVVPPRLPADGESTAQLDIRVADKWGNPVSGVTLATSASAGSVVGSTETEPGLYRVIVRAPSLPGSSTIGVVAGLARDETALAFVRPPPKWAIAAGGGGAHNLGALSTAMGWLEGRRAIGSGEGPWAAVIRGYGSQGGFQVKSPQLQTGPFDVAVRQGLVLGGVRRRFTAPFSGWSLAAVLAAGGGTVEVSEKNLAGTVVASGPAMGGRAALSAERVMGPGAIVVETGYSYVTTDDEIIIGNLGGAELTVGYRHGF